VPLFVAFSSAPVMDAVYQPGGKTSKDFSVVGTEDASKSKDAMIRCLS